ncbi:hypothetical protein DINM_004209 [Dirofilaria immitis]|nr:hypothetical protein [Dirofilaria immitis]
MWTQLRDRKDSTESVRRGKKGFEPPPLQIHLYPIALQHQSSSSAIVASSSPLPTTLMAHRVGVDVLTDQEDRKGKRTIANSINHPRTSQIYNNNNHLHLQNQRKKGSHRRITTGFTATRESSSSPSSSLSPNSDS